MAVHFPVYHSIDVDGFQLYPGTTNEPGLHHQFTPGLHLVAGVNGLGKTTLLLLLYHGLAGPASVRNDDFALPKLELIRGRVADRFRKRVSDAAKDGRLKVSFKIGDHTFEVVRELNALMNRPGFAGGCLV